MGCIVSLIKPGLHLLVKRWQNLAMVGEKVFILRISHVVLRFIMTLLKKEKKSLFYFVSEADAKNLSRPVVSAPVGARVDKAYNLSAIININTSYFLPE